MIFGVFPVFTLFFLLVSTLLFVMVGLNYLKHKQGKRGKKGSLGPTGPAGPEGPAGLEGPTGPAGTGDSTLTLENLIFSNTVTTVLDPTISISSITTYDYDTLNKGELPNTSQGSSKYLALSNNAVAPAQIGTTGGTFLVSNPDSKVQLVFDEGAWKQINGKALTWFPTTQQGSKLVGTGAISPGNQGYSVSADGNTVAVGSPNDDSGRGATWIFVRTGVTWTQQGNKLVGTGAIGYSGQGYSVSLSSDGNTLAVGGYLDDNGIGATWIFVRSAGVWTQQGSKLVGTGAVGGFGLQGSSVSLSADGNTVAVGGPSDDGSVGAVWIFTRSAGLWTQQGSKLVGTGEVGTATQGSSVTLSADGNTLAVGAINDDASTGATWIFIRIGVLWTQQGSKLVGTGVGVAGASYQGISASLSLDGNTLAVGGSGDDNNVGATWMFVRTAGVWSQQGLKLVGTGAIGPAQQGNSVSLADDGNTLAVGGPFDDGNLGATWIFTRAGVNWTQQGSKLVGAGAIGPAQQGWSVALASNGEIVAIGGNNDDMGNGATWVFTRSAGVWSQEGAKLVGTGVGGNASQGFSVSISADGNTLGIGGPTDDNGVGATWIYVRTAGVWSQQGLKLVGTGAVGIASQGYALSISADGNTIAIGGYDDNGGVGATWIFVRTAGVWTQQGSKLVGTGAVGASYQGTSVSLSADGNTLAIGGSGDNSSVGATWIFTRSAGIWSQQGAKLVGSGAVGQSQQGISVSLSKDGNTLGVGGYNDDAGFGATWVFVRSAGVWTQQGSKLFGTGGVDNSYQGSSVSLSADGNTIAIGGSFDDTGKGATWVFVRVSNVWSQQGSKLLGTGAVGASNQGYSVSLSANGNTLSVGGRNDDSNAGATWIFTRVADAWSQRGSKLVGSGANVPSQQGCSVSLSADGNLLAIGGQWDNGYVGATWIFG
jgi:hypothetical protein